MISSLFLRFLANGVVGTVAHYTTLRICIDLLSFPSAGLANLAASGVGISVSFVGNRWFVFERDQEPWSGQLRRFSLLYGVLAAMHWSLLTLWTDIFRLNINVGFTLALLIQMVVSFYGNKYLVFRT